MPLQYSGVTATDTDSGNTSVDNGDEGNGGTLDSLIENAGDIFKGLGSLVSAVNGKPTTVVATGAAASAIKPGINPMYIILGVLVIIVIMAMLFKK